VASILLQVKSIHFENVRHLASILGAVFMAIPNSFVSEWIESYAGSIVTHLFPPQNKSTVML